MTDFLIGGFDFFFEEAKKIWTLRTNFSKANKERTLEISFFKGCRQKFEGTDSSHLWRDGGRGCSRVVTKGRGPGISPGYSEHDPRLLSSLN